MSGCGAPDDYDERRRTLSIEIERPDASEVYVEWLEGYESCVASMALLAGGGCASANHGRNVKATKVVYDPGSVTYGS
jgi:hypothetical protein